MAVWTAESQCTMHATWKMYQKNLISETQSGDDGYPRYRRRAPEDGGFTATLAMKNGTEIEVDNKWVFVQYSILNVCTGERA